MENLHGNLVNKRLIKHQFSKIGDLLYFDGPLMSVYKNHKNPNHLYLFDWAESNDKLNRWLVCELHPMFILNYINQELTHINLIKKSKNIYAVDIDISLNFSVFFKLTFNSIPKSYLPEEHCIFDVNECQNLDKIRAYLDKMLILQSA